MLENLGQVLPCGAKKYGDKTAVVTGGRSFSFSDLNHLSGRLASGLSGLGITAGDRVTLSAQNGWEWIVSYYAIAWLGAVVNPINVMLTAEEVAYVVKDCGARAMLVPSARAKPLIGLKESCIGYLEHPFKHLDVSSVLDLEVLGKLTPTLSGFRTNLPGAPSDMVENSINLCNPISGWFFRQWTIRTGHLFRNEVPFERFYRHLPRLLGGMILQPALASVALKRKPAARGTRALPLLSTVGSFSLLPSPELAGDSVVPDVCHLALAAVRASHTVLREDAQNGSKPATTPDGRAGVEAAAPWPTSVVPARLFHGAPSDSPVQ